MFKKRLKGLLAMVLAGSIAATALPLTASAAINGYIAIREGGEQDPNGITQDGITFGTLNSDYSDCLNASNLWGVYRWPDIGCGYVLESVSGDKLAEKLYEIKTSDTAWNVEIRKSHKVLVTTEKPEPGLSTADAITVDSFPAHFDLPDGFVTNNPLRHSAWTVWHGIEDMNTICEYPPLEKYGEPHTISADSTGIELPMTEVSGLYSVTQSRFFSGITIIQFQNDYKTFDIPVYTGTGQPEMNGKKLKTIAVTANDDAYLDEGRRFYLTYDTKPMDKSAADIGYTKVSEVWNKIEELAATEANFDAGKLMLMRDVTVTVCKNSGEGEQVSYNSYDLARWAYEVKSNKESPVMPEALEYLISSDTKGIWRIIPNAGQGYSQKFLYLPEVLDEIADYLQHNPTENKIYLYEIDRIYVTADPGNYLKNGYWLPLESVYTSPMLVIDPADEEASTKIQAKISDHAAVLHKAEPVEPGYTYDVNEWQLWGAYFSSGYVQDSIKADLSGVERTDSLSLKQLEKVNSNSQSLLIYFPQVEIAPSLEVTAPVVGETPSTEYTIVDEVGGYRVISVEWSCGNTLLGKNDKFEAGKKYTVTMQLSPDVDLSFVDSTPVIINGEKAEYSSLDEWGLLIASQSFTTAPEKPANVKATAGNGKVDLSWEEGEGAYGYRVYFYNEDDTLRQIATVEDLNDLSCTIENLANGTEYGFLITAVSEAGVESSYTAEDVVYATPFDPKPQNVKAAPGDGQVTLTWDKVTGASKYIVYSILNGQYTNRGTTTGTSLTVTGLANGTKYGFLVQAYVNGAWTKFTAEDIVYATPVASAKPVITLTAGDGKVDVKWNAVSGASKYIVYSILNGQYTNRGTTTGTSFTVTGLTNNTKYGFLVQAYVNGAWTAFTAEDIKYATPIAKPVVTATPGDKQVKLTWNTVSGASKYIV
ncbi:MAG: fibronectin type III domain-containing protein, partial [Oscillospiraceae bacterium]